MNCVSVVYHLVMRTNINLDDALVEEAMALSGERTKTGAVHRALSELVRLERLRRVRTLRGKLQWKGNLNALRERGQVRHGSTR